MIYDVPLSNTEVTLVLGALALYGADDSEDVRYARETLTTLMLDDDNDGLYTMSERAFWVCKDVLEAVIDDVKTEDPVAVAWLQSMLDGPFNPIGIQTHS